MLILASASPRRQELLRNAGIAFKVEPAEIDETPLAGELPRDCAERLAREKARTVHRRRPQHRVLGADTVVVVDEVILGKPRDRDDAARMLRLLSGRQHTVITGICLIEPYPEDLKNGDDLKTGERPRAALETATSEATLVTMSRISEEEILDYVATGEPMDKAGAYAIQGIASRWIPRIEGDYSNVVGLPIARVYAMLRG
jgi:septum formation protein